MVGSKIQEFSLPNSRGEKTNIRDLQGKNVVVILLRDINWPYCRWHIGHLRRDYDKFQAQNTELYPILVDKKENAEKMEQKYARNTYPIYYDKKEKVSKMLNQEKKLLKLGRMPGLLILDKDNVIKYAYYSDSMKDIPENDELFEIIENLNN